MRSLLVMMVIALCVVPQTAADHCTTYTTSIPEVTSPTLAGETFYVDLFLCQICDWWWIYPYQESNGIEGLQRGDGLEDDTCHGMIAPDTMVF